MGFFDEGFELMRFDALARPLLVAKGSKGFAACAYVDEKTAELLGEACVIFSGVSCHDDFLSAQVKRVNPSAEKLGIAVGMQGKDALELIRSSSIKMEDEEEDRSAADLQLSDNPFAIDFHPRSLDVLAVGLVNGVVSVHDVRKEEEEEEKESCRVVLKSAKDRGSCRVVSWRQSCGGALFSGYESGGLVAWDVEARSVSWQARLSGSASSCLSVENTFACGDDSGNVYVWDVRTTGGAVLNASVHEDYVSGLECHDGTLLSCGADGRLCVSDPRRNLASVAKSDPQDDELLSVRVMKNGRKVVCGTQTGALVIWSWGRWGDSSDRALGHPESVDAMLKVDEDVLCTGSSDGLIRVCKIQPGLKLLGILGDHDTFPVERLAANHDMSMVASISHDSIVRFWDSRELSVAGAAEQGDDHDRMETEEADDDAEAWETDDSDDDDDDDDDGTMMAQPSRGQQQQQKHSRLKSNSDSFFDGL